MNDLTTIQLLVAFIAVLGIGFFTCYTMLYEDLKEKYDKLLQEKEEFQADPTQDTYNYRNVA